MAVDFIAYCLSKDGQAIATDNGYIGEDGADFTSAQPEGKIVVGGSSSVSPLMEKLIEAYKTVNPNAELELQTTDSTTGTTTYSDEEKNAAKQKAEEILDEWMSGDATEDSFAALAEEKSEDPGSSTNGGLYENVAKGQMVEPFEDWCFDETRAAGDYGLVKTKYGYHVMYFVSSTPIWETYAKSGWVNEKTNAFIKKLAEDHPMEVDYSAIKLGYVNLGA